MIQGVTPSFVVVRCYEVKSFQKVRYGWFFFFLDITIVCPIHWK